MEQNGSATNVFSFYIYKCATLMKVDVTERGQDFFTPWPNGVASRRKLKTWVYLRLRLVRPYMHALELTCADLRSLWSTS